VIGLKIKNARIVISNMKYKEAKRKDKLLNYELKPI